MGKIYVVMGKSASGKDTLYRKLIENRMLNLKTVILYTTRPIRDGEIDGVEYNFVSNEKLEEFKNTGKIIELRSYETYYGIWNYFTVDDGQIELTNKDYIMIGTIESYLQIKKYYGEENVLPLYIEINDGDRLQRALNRERKQLVPKYEEMCRRFLADAKDFSDENLIIANITKRYNNFHLNECVIEIREDILANRRL